MARFHELYNIVIFVYIFNVIEFRVATLPGDSKWLSNFPKIEIPGGGSDHSPFFTYLGIPVVDFRYSNGTSTYPLYHTLYETPFLNEHLFDLDKLAVSFNNNIKCLNFLSLGT